jgi:hypothetical protein
MKQSLKKKLVLIFFVISICATSQAQAPGFGDDVDDNSGSGSSLPAIPLDGGLSLLVVAGVAYGAKSKLGIRN